MRTDRSQQFVHSLLYFMKNISNKKRVWTTIGHTASNGLVESFYYQLKAAPESHSNLDWCETVLPVLPCMIARLRADIQRSAAKLVFGSASQMPG